MMPGGPTYGAAGTRLADATDTTAPLAVPAGVVAGSVVVACLFRVSNGETAYEPLTLPDASWSLANHNPGLTIGGTFHRFMADVMTHRATGPESGTYNFSWPTSRFRVGFAVRLDNVRNSGTPYEDDSAGADGNASVTTPPVQVTTTGPDRLNVWIGWSWTTGAWTPPAGYTTRVADVPFDLITLATADQPVAGSSGVLTGSQTSEAKAAWLGAFAPPAATPPTDDAFFAFL